MAKIETTREIAESAENIFAAFSDADRLSRWWGPAGFTNTFDLCEFKPGGRWVFTMHDAEGKSYANESIFKVIEPFKKIVIQHICEPKFVLTIELTPTDGGTMLSWSGDFENADFVANAENFLKAANEQNLDRLEAEVCSPKFSSGNK